jgi:hypothetical protein
VSDPRAVLRCAQPAWPRSAVVRTASGAAMPDRIFRSRRRSASPSHSRRSQVPHAPHGSRAPDRREPGC